MFIGHSKGLGLLFMTEMWERFSFYTLRALLVLYMVSKTLDGGLGWTRKEAFTLYGMYLGMAYVTPVIGGYLSDRFLGQRRSAMIGAILMAWGHLLMAVQSLPFFYAALSLVAIGNGFFKPCLTSILGQLYDDSTESHRDSAYSIFYMGINIGGMLAGFVSGWMLEAYGYDAGFAIAGLGMIIATLIFWWGQNRYLGDIGIKPTVKVVDHHAAPLTKEEKSRLFVVFILFLIVICFVTAWEQMGGLVTIFIQENVDRTIGNWTIPTPWLANLDPLFIVFLAPLFSILWVKLGEMEMDPFIGIKIGIGCLFLAGSFIILGYMVREISENGTLPHWSWIVLNKFLMVIGELCVIPISWAAATKLSPKSYISRVMGFMLAGIGVGSYLAGRVGALVDEVGEQAIFDTITIALCLLSVICILLNGKLKKLTHHQ